MDFAFTLRSLTSTLLPVRTIGMFSQTRTKSPKKILAAFLQNMECLQRTVPVGDVLVCDTRGNIEHDNTALAVDVVAVTKATELLLACCVPDIELDRSEVLA